MRDPSRLREVAVDLAPRLRDALGLLQEARGYAHNLQVDVWDFAVELSNLQGVGLTSSDLRWLVCKGYVEHAAETTPSEKGHREFQRQDQLTLTPQTCFILTELGLAVARSAYDPSRNSRPDRRADVSIHGKDDRPPEKPIWDAALRELCFGDILVKRFKVPAPNQELILASFQEEGWPLYIDDPLPPHHDINPKRRLHDTINRLNRNQRRRVIRFLGNGDGRGLRWESLR